MEVTETPGLIMQYLPSVVLALGHLAGLIVTIVLLVRRRGTAAVLAMVAFLVLLLVDVGTVLQMAFLDALWEGLVARLTAGFTGPGALRSLALAQQYLTGGLTCCCAFLDVGAIVCLIVALWQGIRGPAGGGGEAATGEAVAARA